MRTKLWIGSGCALALLAIGAVWALPNAKQSSCASCNETPTAAQPACCADDCCTKGCCADGCCDDGCECCDFCAALGCVCPDCCESCCATPAAAVKTQTAGAASKACCTEQPGKKCASGCCEK